MATGKTAKTADRAKKSADSEIPCHTCGKPTRVVKRMKDRSMGVSGGMFRSCSTCDYAAKL
jgi:DNA-directed RNA polymerase subunit M/transcription elongation factor TFIIS